MMGMMTSVVLVRDDDLDDTTYYECKTQVEDLVSRGYIDETQFEIYLAKFVEKRRSINSTNSGGASTPPRSNH